MIIGIRLVIIILMVIILGEIKYRLYDKKEAISKIKNVSKDWNDNIDTNMDKLSMEYAKGEFVPGSWRLAQNQVMGIQAFDILRAEEYSRML